MIGWLFSVFDLGVAVFMAFLAYLAFTDTQRDVVSRTFALVFAAVAVLMLVQSAVVA